MRLFKGLWGAFALLIVCTAVHADEEQEARRLLQRAVDYYQAQGDAAFAAFSRQGEFIDGEHYVFVVDTHGIMLASGGSSAVLIGRDVSQVLEPELRGAFQQALAGEEAGVRVAEYGWMNTRDSRVERKRVFFQRVGDRVIAVGLYLPRATPESAAVLLDRAVQALKQDPQGSIAAINDLSPRFREDDLYVFVIDLRSGRYLAHGYNLRLLGVDFAKVKDPDGKPVGKPILDLMKGRSEGGYDYRWKNPVTGKIEDKYALLRKQGDRLVAVGYYKRLD
ncbi:Calcium channel protein [Pseudomonas reidholzensis]|uniref:Calcium channel protein n=1 Tax=Pseudomonas reidholzensis TaxID=1785162 RepID=A0A383RY45_9PSED|nr:cache domain-containing protein [Pseudomonas reidholzensis]SYX91815.1 Calcium channel protein [Pseudomonas reidholzensis]